jgi:hypothetical protein
LLAVGVLSLALMGMSPSKHLTKYKEIPVHDGGTISGRVLLKGSVPPPRMFRLSLYPFGSYCKKISDGQGNVLLEEFNVGPAGGLQDAVVAVQNVEAGKPFHLGAAKYFATDCMFHPADVPPTELYTVDKMGHAQHVHPLVSVIRNHMDISVINKDPIFHNGQVFQEERGNIMLNFPLPPSDKPRGGVLNFQRGKKIGEMICGMHEFMQTWDFVVDNPYYAKTRGGGAFRIDQLPPGTYKVIAWHPHLKPIEKEVTISGGDVVSLDFEFDSSQVKRPTFETKKGMRNFQ